MIDIHSHILWEVDDGASTLEASLAMLRSAAETGTTDIVATPHMNSRYVYQPEVAAQRTAELTAALAGAPRIHRGCEMHLTLDNVEMVLRSPAAYTINGGPYLLIELPHAQVGTHIGAVLEHLLRKDITPIVAHPERNPALQSKPQLVEAWVDFGCLMQLTASSLLGGFGAAAKTASAWMLEHGLAHTIASDCHDPVHRHPRLDAACAAVRARYGDSYAEALFHENPRNVIQGLPLSAARQTEVLPAASWWQFWK